MLAHRRFVAARRLARASAEGARRRIDRAPFALGGAAGPRVRQPLEAGELLYDGELARGWDDWGWGPHQLGSGPAQIKFSGFGGILFHHARPARALRRTGLSLPGARPFRGISACFAARRRQARRRLSAGAGAGSPRRRRRRRLQRGADRLAGAESRPRALRSRADRDAHPGGRCLGVARQGDADTARRDRQRRRRTKA